jgi:TRAP-type C4-dicarboxylate transport system substrate-binding protein
VNDTARCAARAAETLSMSQAPIAPRRTPSRAVAALTVASLVTALAAAALAAPAAAQTRTLKLATLVPDGSVWDKELRAMAAEVQRQTQGRVVLRIYPGGVAGDDPDVVRKMRLGQLQAATLTVSGLSEIDDGFEVFSVPRFFASYDELWHVTRAIEPMLVQRLEAKGFVMLGWGHGGWINLFSKQPINAPADLQRLKLFSWAGNDAMTQWWKSHGYRPVPLASTDIMTGLTTGMIEALPTTPLAALTLQWYRPTPYMLDLGVAPLVGATVVSKKGWDAIAPADQQIVRQLARQMEERLRGAIPEQDRKAVEEMSRRGLKVTHPGPEQMKAWERAAEEFAASMRQQMVPADVFDAAAKARQAFRSQRASG